MATIDRREGCDLCRYTKYKCDPVKRLLGWECEDYQKMPNKNLFTCFKCKDIKTCPFAWDQYNLNGDCLATK